MNHKKMRYLDMFGRKLRLADSKQLFRGSINGDTSRMARWNSAPKERRLGRVRPQDRYSRL